MSIELIDPRLCNGCAKCLSACPLDVIRLDTIVEDNNEYPSCRLACPAEVDMRRYIYLLKIGMLDEAINVLRESLPLPAVTGRVCPHPCESECSRREVDDAVNINALERFVADYWIREKGTPVRQIYAARTAIIGSGPAGLSCAYFLVRKGYPVTVFEAMPVLGGMLRTGIPEYRLPKEILEAQINYIRDLGIEFKTGITIGKDITLEELRNNYQAVFYAPGNQLSRKLSIKGAELDGVRWGLEFLRGVNLNQGTRVKDKVVVIGGGNVAIDAALTALRSGAKEVQLACLETGANIPAFKDGIKQAIDEGVTIHEGWGPKLILSENGRVTGIELVRCVKVFDDNGEFNPSYNERETKVFQAQTVIMSIGQTADLSLIPQGMKLTRENTIQVDPITLETTLPGVFSGGDVTSGPASVVNAIAAGKKAFISISRFLKGEDMRAGRQLRPNRVKNPPKEGMEKLLRRPAPTLPANERHGNFEEVNHGFDEDLAHLESQRCMTCGSRAIISYVDDCQLCLHCELDCPQKAVYVSPDRKTMPLIAWA
jgi:NADPH-dependent glutamate synthase beta subunit-like oxidoreductase/NAD-dependent dihydropyrimidine dehydrogenase PreA subunit